LKEAENQLRFNCKFEETEEQKQLAIESNRAAWDEIFQAANLENLEDKI
jgi:hypothetical protein